MTSSLRMAPDPMAFSATHINNSNGCFKVIVPSVEHFANASKAPSMAAAPPISAFIPGIEPPTFKDNPPVSNEMPLPTKAIGLSDAFTPFGTNVKRINAGSLPSVEADWPTAAMHPIPSRRNSLSLQTCDLTPPTRFAAAKASSTIPCGSILVGGVSTMRHASSTASLIAFAFFDVASDAPLNATTIGSGFVSSSFSEEEDPLLFIENTGNALVNAFTKLPKSLSFSLAITTLLVFPSPHVPFAISCNPCAPLASLCLDTCVGNTPIAISCTTVFFFSFSLVPVWMTVEDAFSFFALSKNASINFIVFSSTFFASVSSSRNNVSNAFGFPIKLKRSNNCCPTSENAFEELSNFKVGV
mmetsp:Transcript_8128/g.25685  ORF Transcript_8128/g.25685 Transcript_8128/m.25685 type:complete len:357 (+) Transcript_8128:1758-2828(+)